MVQSATNQLKQIQAKFENLYFGIVHCVIVQLSQMSHEKKPVDIPLYWLVNRDPYNGIF